MEHSGRRPGSRAMAIPGWPGQRQQAIPAGVMMRILIFLLPSAPAWAWEVDSPCSFEPWNCSRHVPEPETLALLVIGAVAALVARRRK